MKLIQLSQISISVYDNNKAVSFYQALLGLPLLFHTVSMTLIESNGTRLLLSVPESDVYDHPSSILNFDVKDIYETFDHFSKLGVSFRGKPHMIAKTDHSETWMVFFGDPEKNSKAFISEVLI